ncbi:Sua5/YciO/YrdC/YwlC family protein [bacterium]|nr:Sua5/YciO/YrdC/YwlC family protein [bacterium]
MGNKKISSTKWQPVVFNGNRLASDRAEQKWIVDLLSRGKVIACPSEIGMVVWTRADRDLSVKMSSLADMVPRNCWAVGLADRAGYGEYWRSMEASERLERLLRVFWPGPLFILNVAGTSAGEGFKEAFGRKLPLWMPNSQLCSTIIKLCPFPLASGIIRRKNDITPLTPKLVGELYGSYLELVIDGRETPGKLSQTVLDISAADWRLVHRGQIGAEEIVSVCGGCVILSGEADDAAVGSRTSGVRLVIFEGESERVVRRMRAFAEGLESTEALYYFVHSQSARAAFAQEEHLHLLCGDRPAEEIREALAWQKLALETWDVICQLEKQQDAAVILMEGVPRNECTEEFMDRITKVAYQVINLMSSDD